MDKIVIMQKRFRTLWLLILVAIIVLVAIVGIVVGVMKNNLIIIIAGVSGTLIFTVLLIVVIKKNLITRPLLVIYEKGIIDKSTSVSVGYLGWSEIESFAILDNQFIGVNVYDLDKIISRINPSNQANIKRNILQGDAPIAIRLDSANMKIEEILMLLQSKLK